MRRYIFCLCVAVTGALRLDSVCDADLVLTENFDDGVLDPRLVATTYPNFHVEVANGLAEFSKDAGRTEYGAARINTDFRLVGDFDVSVQVHRDSSSCCLGVATFFSDGPFNESDPFADVYFTPSAIAFGVSDTFYTEVASANPTAVFRLTRQGDTITGMFDQGSGFQTLASRTGPALSGPVRVGLFLTEEFRFQGATSGWFDNLVISGAVIPEPSAFMLQATWIIALLASQLRRTKKPRLLDRGCNAGR